MKKFICLLTCSIMFVGSLMAQHTTPRYGTAANQNNTYSALNLGLKSYADEASLDTIKLIPNNYHTDVFITLTDTVSITFTSIASSWKGDKMVITINNTAGASHYVSFVGNADVYSGATKWGMSASGTANMTLASTKTAVITFTFDGAIWNETSRVVQ